MELQLALINREIENAFIPQRASDGFINATAMCQAAGKLFADYRRNATTEAFLAELAADMGIPISDLVFSSKGGRSDWQGTWVHPDVAVNLAQWCSPKFAVAVSRWVREWLSGKIQTTKLPYHLERYMANRKSVPQGYWSMLNELTLHLIAPLEQAGYQLPEHMVPDISTGLMFCKVLRDARGVDTASFKKYSHVYGDGRIVQANLYPDPYLPDFRDHFFNTWMPKRALGYFHEKHPAALPFLRQFVALPDNPSVDNETAKALFEKVKGVVASKKDEMK